VYSDITSKTNMTEEFNSRYVCFSTKHIFTETRVGRNTHKGVCVCVCVSNPALNYMTSNTACRITIISEYKGFVYVGKIEDLP